MNTPHKFHIGPMDFFMNLGIVALLYFIVINILILAFQTIDVAFPPSLDAAQYGIPDISFQLAALIIGFPALVVFLRMLYKDEVKNPEKREFFVRTWSTYLSLFISGAVVAVDLMVLLKTFLNGEDITLGFALKVFAVFLVLGLTFAYYLIDLRYTGKLPLRMIVSLKSIAVVLIALSFGFYVFGSPATQRAKRFDATRVSDLQNIQYQVLSYWQTKHTVPTTLKDLSDPLTGMQIPHDPKTGDDYSYEKKSGNVFSLCATFEREGGTIGSDMTARKIPVIGGSGEVSEYWGHTTGLVCFDRTIDEARYKLQN